MRNNYQNWEVSYWTHDPKINNCVGNAKKWTGKARTHKEATGKAEKYAWANKEPYFRLRHAATTKDCFRFEVDKTGLQCKIYDTRTEELKFLAKVWIGKTNEWNLESPKNYEYVDINYALKLMGYPNKTKKLIKNEREN